MFRHHRGGLAASMKTAVEVKDINQLLEILRLQLGWLEIAAGDVEVRLYHDQPDKRIGWDKTYIVTVKTQTASGPVAEPAGFTDGEVPGCG